MRRIAKVVCLFTVLVGVPMMVVAQDIKREETVFAGGSMWNTPGNWNPFTYWSMTPGTLGMVYETLFQFNPIKGEYTPFLAADQGKWTSADTFELKVREGVKWNDGKPFSAEDVAFTFNVAKTNKGIFYSNLWDFLKEVTAVDASTVRFVLKTPRYASLKYQLYQIAMLPKHVFDGKAEKDLLSSPNKNPVGTGSYREEIATEDRDIFVRNDDWWGKKVFGKLPAPKRVVIVKMYSNNVALGMIMKGELDITNNFLAGVPTIKKGYGLHTYFEKTPYMVPFNTALVYLNAKKAPLSDPKLRRAMAFAINSKMITERAYDNTVEVADPTGLPKAMLDYADKALLKKMGFKYDPATANKLLDAAGYKDVNKDKFREDPKGKPFKLQIVCPFGWTDWNEAIKVVAENMRTVGLNVEAGFPDYNKYTEMMQGGTFDLLLNNWNTNPTTSPYTYWSYIATDDIKGEKALNGNFGRYSNQKLFDLITKFDQTNPETHAADSKKIATQIEEILLQDMPSIPLWYNGAWFLANTQYWTNWPDEKNKFGLPLLYHGTWQMGGLNMLMNLEPAKKK